MGSGKCLGPPSDVLLVDRYPSVINQAGGDNNIPSFVSILHYVRICLALMSLHSGNPHHVVPCARARMEATLGISIHTTSRRENLRFTHRRDKREQTPWEFQLPRLMRRA